MLAKYDSVSCLHALEHFGLGRYGDKIEPKGHKYGIQNFSDIMVKNGILYLSVPIENKSSIQCSQSFKSF